MRRNRDQGMMGSHSSGGPLLTNHLRDLDMELELLKRKRQIIQQEHQMISRYNSKKQYEQPSNNYNRQDNHRQNSNANNFSHMYDDGPSNSGNFRPQGNKRPANNWQNPSPPKRFNAPQRVSPWQNQETLTLTQMYQARPQHFQNRPQNFQSGPQNRNFQQSVQISQPPRFSRPNPNNTKVKPNIGQATKKNFVPPHNKDFKPNKVTKPMKPQVPNKLASYPIQKTKKLISQTLNTSGSKDNLNVKVIDMPPSQVKGRLELALGSIVKEIREKYCTDHDSLQCFQTPFIQRIIKSAIRTRLREVQLNKVVGTSAEIVANYRQKFPIESDAGFVKVIKEAQRCSNDYSGMIQLIDADSPLVFFKKNVLKLLDVKLEEMFAKVLELYRDSSMGINELINNLPEVDEQSNKNVPDDKTANGDVDKAATEGKDDQKEKESTETKKTDNIETEHGENSFAKTLDDQVNKLKQYTEFANKLMEEILPKLLPKFKDSLMSLLYSDKEYFATKVNILTEMRKKVLAGNKDKPDTNTNKIDLTPNKNSAQDKGSTPVKNTSTDKDTELVKNVSEAPKAAFKETVTEAPKTPVKEIVTEAPKTPAPITAKKTASHYVKLIGRPNLPARAVIYEFLNKFNPASIKKHKSIGNLLVIGFANKEDFDNMLTANESVVGEATLIIKASEQTAKPDTPSQKPQKANESVTKPNDSFDESLVINSDLEHQITDLLSSIRQADEEISKDEKSDDKQEEQEKAESDKSEKVDGSEKTEAMETGEIDSEKMANEKSLEEKEAEKTNNEKSPEEKEPEKAANEKTPEEKDPEKTANENSTTENNDAKNAEKPSTELETISETNEIPTNGNEKSKTAESNDVKGLKETGRATPTRASSRLATSTPRTIRTRRTSQLLQNQNN